MLRHVRPRSLALSVANRLRLRLRKLRLLQRQRLLRQIVALVKAVRAPVRQQLAKMPPRQSRVWHRAKPIASVKIARPIAVQHVVVTKVAALVS